MTNYLRSHPTEEGYLIEDVGEPIKSKDSHTFRFSFNKIQYSETLSFGKPIIREPNEHGIPLPKIGEIEKNKYTNLIIEMVPDWEYDVYSYIGSTEIIKSFELIVLDLNTKFGLYGEKKLKLKTPHIIIFPSEARLSDPKLTVHLYLEKKQIQDINQRIQENKINGGDLSFKFDKDTHGDLIFDPLNSYEQIPDQFLKDNLKNYSSIEYQTIHTDYPYKILPADFKNFEGTIVQPYDYQPITEFDLTFEKNIPVNAKKYRYSPEIDDVMELYLTKRMLKVR